MTLIDSHPTIEILPEHIIDQIKAGEVLERPASLLKELIENSLDAKATEINIHLVENGMDLLSIEDNGQGMTFKDLPYAFLRHATSKLKTFEDLYRLHSFGFRGEALASVAASSRLTCTSQPADLNKEGGKIMISGGETTLIIPQKSSSQGTSLFIKDLFYNTPARLKFVKSKVSEKAAIKKMIYSFVLCNPQVSFAIKWDEKEREVFKALPDGEHHKRIAQVFFGKKTDSALYEASEEYDNYKVKVFFTPETYGTPQYRHHYLFANKRFFQDKSLHSAVLRNLDFFWRYGESGHYYVEITTPPAEIDVNVHPNKTQIKFMRSDVVYSLLVTSLKKAIKQHAIPAPLPASRSPETGSFFSREENQTFDLMQFSGQDQSEQSGHEEISRPFFFETVKSQSDNYFRLSRQFLVDQSRTPLKLIDCKKMLSLYIARSFTNVIETNETPTPLLISEPFNIKDKRIDESFDFLKSIGMEFDRLNPEFIVLRTVPRFLSQAWTIDVSEAMIEFCLKKIPFTLSALSSFLEQHCSQNILDEITPAIVEQMLKGPDAETFSKVLSDQLLKSLFEKVHE